MATRYSLGSGSNLRNHLRGTDRCIGIWTKLIAHTRLSVMKYLQQLLHLWPYCICTTMIVKSLLVPKYRTCCNAAIIDPNYAIFITIQFEITSVYFNKPCGSVWVIIFLHSYIHNVHPEEHSEICKFVGCPILSYVQYNALILSLDVSFTVRTSLAKFAKIKSSEKWLLCTVFVIIPHKADSIATMLAIINNSNDLIHCTLCIIVIPLRI